MSNNSDICLKKMLSQDRITCFFQPIIAARQQKIAGVEALCRGLAEDGSILSPALLFALAEKEGLRLELDRRCREKAVEIFAGLHCVNPDMLLFFNLDVSIIKKETTGSGHLINTVEKAGINPGNIVIEIIENRITDQEAFEIFLNTYREYGFLIGLDDVGSGYSNLDRISLIKPDIIKLDRELLSHMDKAYHKQAVVRALIDLSKKIGALVVAEGLEREEEVLCCIDAGADFLQGYYLARPELLYRACASCNPGEIVHIADKFKRYYLEKLAKRKILYRDFCALLNSTAMQLMKLAIGDSIAFLEKLLVTDARIACLYLLNEKGIQLSHTIFNDTRFRVMRGGAFHPAGEGADQSMKEYFLVIQSGSDRFISEPYISLASGSLCVTFSWKYQRETGETHIICMDINADDMFD